MKLKTIILAIILVPVLIGGVTNATSASDKTCQEILDECEADNPYHWLFQAEKHQIWDNACESSYDSCIEPEIN